MISAKAVITIDTDEDGRPFASIIFDPPLPERPDDPAEEDKWLEQIPSAQLAGFVIMDQLMDMFGDDLEMQTISDTCPPGNTGNDTRH